MLGALRHRNFKLFFAGGIVSQVGTWMQTIAQSWLVLQLTHSAVAVGLVVAAQFLPVLLVGQFGGLVADRFPKRRVLLMTQVAFILPAAFLFTIEQAHVTQVWMVFGAAVATGCVSAVEVPVRQSFVIEMVGREDLMNAIALQSSIFTAASVVGPSVAGVLIATVGIQVCFLVNAVSYLAVIGALLLMSGLPAVTTRPSDGESAFQRMRAGASYAAHDPTVGMVLVAVSVFSLFAMNRQTLIPVFADTVLGVGARGYGFLMAAAGLGALGGALVMAYLGPGGADPRRQFWTAIVWTVSLVGFSISRMFVLSLFLLVITGFCQMTFLAISNTRIQTTTPDHLRGRVMALYAQAVLGVSPFGSAQAGLLAGALGPQWSMAIGAIVAGAVVVGIRVVRPGTFQG